MASITDATEQPGEGKAATGCDDSISLIPGWPPGAEHAAPDARSRRPTGHPTAADKEVHGV